MILNLLNLSIVAMAVWRVANLIANEEGPFRMFLRLRMWAIHVRSRFLHNFGFPRLLHCEWCNSIWIASAAVWLFDVDIPVRIVLVFALSGYAIVIKYLVHTLQNLCEVLDNIKNGGDL